MAIPATKAQASTIDPRHWNKAVWIYVGLFSLWLILRLIFFDKFWWLALITYGAEYWFVPLPILSLVVALRRQWGSLIPLLIPALAFGVMFGRFFLPKPAPPPHADQPLLTIMTFNLLWENENYAAIGAAVRAANPDVLGVEELHPTHYAGIVAELKDDYPYYTPIPPDPFGGVGVFSKYPIVAATPFPLPPRNLSMQATLDIQGRQVQVFVVHLSANNMIGGYPLGQFIPIATERNTSRLSETAQLREIVSPITDPVLLLCDCNMSDTTESYQTMASFLRDSHAEVGWGLAHTIRVPGIPLALQRIDYVWHNAGLVALNTEVGIDGGSDHLPFIARLGFTQP